MDANIKQELKDFLATEQYCVLSTVSNDHHPLGAVMAFVTDDDMHFFVSTAKKTLKYQHLTESSKVAITLGWDPEKMITVQVKGTADIMEPGKDDEKLAKMWEALVTKHPFSKRFQGDPESVLIEITPSIIKFAELKEGKASTLEF